MTRRAEIMNSNWFAPLAMALVLFAVGATIMLAPRGPCRAYVPEPGETCNNGLVLRLHEHYAICACVPKASP